MSKSEYLVIIGILLPSCQKVAVLCVYVRMCREQLDLILWNCAHGWSASKPLFSDHLFRLALLFAIP